MTASHDVTDEYRVLLQSLEIPTRALPPSSRRTPEWEVLNDIRTHFAIPGGVETREPVVNYLSANVPLDDFFSFLGFIIKPFARMVVEIYDFLSRFERTAASGQTVTEIRIGARTAFPVNLKFMPRELLKLLMESTEKDWDFDALSPLHNYLNVVKSIAPCDGRNGGQSCRPECFQPCRDASASVAKDIESVLRADDRVTRKVVDASVAGAPVGARLRPALRETFEEFLHIVAEGYTGRYSFASDCLPAQARGIAPDELYALKTVRKVQEVLERAATEIKVLREEVKEFLKLPYWRRRNDLYEVWVLTKVCGLLPAGRIQLCNLDAKGRWSIPGNGQGRIDAPVLRLEAPSGNYRLYTGLNLSGYQHPGEKSGGVRGGMPDWLFCREVDDFDFDQFNNEAGRFRSEGVVPEFIVECKAGASYGLSDTVEKTMRRRYLPLLRTERGRAVLVNYCRFHVPAGLDKNPAYRDSVRRCYRQILAVDALAPGAAGAQEELLQAARGVFGLDDGAGKTAVNPVDFMLVVDTTGSMHGHLNDLADAWSECVEAVGKRYGDVRCGAVAVGDHGRGGFGDVYDVLLYPLADGGGAAAFLKDVERSGGGDTPEAYEDALHMLAASPWREGATRLAVFFGDAYPHPTVDCPSGFDWEAELATLKQLGVVVHCIKVPSGPGDTSPDEELKSEAFFNRVSSETGGRMVKVASGAEALAAILDCAGV